MKLSTLKESNSPDFLQHIIHSIWHTIKFTRYAKKKNMTYDQEKKSIETYSKTN